MSSRSNYTNIFDPSGSDGRTVTPMIATSFPDTAPPESFSYDGAGWIGPPPVQAPPVQTFETSSKTSTTALFLLPILISVIVLVLAVGLICTRCFVRARNQSVTPRNQSIQQAAVMEEHTKKFHNLQVADGNEGTAEYPVAYATAFADGGAAGGGDIGGATAGGFSSGDAGGGAACGI